MSATGARAQGSQDRMDRRNHWLTMNRQGLVDGMRGAGRGACEASVDQIPSMRYTRPAWSAPGAWWQKGCGFGARETARTQEIGRNQEVGRFAQDDSFPGTALEALLG